MFQLVADLECNKCHGIYQNTDRDTLSVLYHSCYFSICPKCTEEVCTLMGLDKKELIAKYCKMKEAETENNKQRRIKEGIVCAGCGIRFIEAEARIRKSSASNVESWHVNCYSNQ